MRFLLFIDWLAVPLSAIAQPQLERKCPPGETYKSLRYDEDWSGLRDPECRTDPFDELKFVPLGEQAYMSLGGEARLRYERYTNPGFGTDPQTNSGYLLQRYLFHSDIHFTSAFRLFVQFQSGVENDRNGGPRPTDEDIAEFHQGFLDIPIVHFGDSPLIVRIGRQELEFGSGRMMGAAEGLNIRRSFDGSLSLQPRQVELQLDSAPPSRAESGSFRRCAGPYPIVMGHRGHKTNTHGRGFALLFRH